MDEYKCCETCNNWKDKSTSEKCLSCHVTDDFINGTTSEPSNWEAKKWDDQPTIKDSGNRRTFESGAQRDMSEGKGRMDLLPWAAILEVSKHCENGAKKYGEHNVDKGLPLHSFCDSGARHLAKFMDGQTDEPHLLAAAWNLLWAIQMTLKHPEQCDVPWWEEHKT